MSLLKPAGTVIDVGIPMGLANWVPPTATSGTDSAATNGTLYYTSLYVPYHCILNSINFLIGSVGGTDKVIASLHDSSGAVLANSAIAGTTVGTAANTQALALTAPYRILGPDMYFVGLTFNGTTAKFRSILAFCSGGLWAGSATQTFGTVAAFTPSSTAFTADKAPMVFLS